MANYDFKKLDYSKLKYNVYDLPKGKKVLDKWPELAVHPEFQGYPEKHLDDLLKFVIYAYDKGSPFLHIIDKEKRHKLCVAAAGIRDKVLIEKILSGADRHINGVIRCYIIDVQSCRKYRMYTSILKAFDELDRNVSTDLDEDDELDPDKLQKAYKSKYENSVNIGQYATRLEELEKEIFPRFSEIEGIINDKEASAFAAGMAENLSDIFASKS